MIRLRSSLIRSTLSSLPPRTCTSRSPAAMARTVLFQKNDGDFPFHVRHFDPATDYPACVDLLRLSMHSIRVDVPGSDQQVEPVGVDEFVSGILKGDMAPGQAGIPTHYSDAPRSAFWVAEATRPRDSSKCLPDTEYPFIAGMLALRPSRTCDPEYEKLCAELELDADKEATLNRMVTASSVRRRGVARALLTVAEDMARASGFIGLHLGTASTGRAAVNFYLDNGFIVQREVSFPMKISIPDANTGKNETVTVSGIGLAMRKVL